MRPLRRLRSPFGPACLYWSTPGYQTVPIVSNGGTAWKVRAPVTCCDRGSAQGLASPAASFNIVMKGLSRPGGAIAGAYATPSLRLTCMLKLVPRRP